jgi:hypothetical protein
MNESVELKKLKALADFLTMLDGLPGTDKFKHEITDVKSKVLDTISLMRKIEGFKDTEAKGCSCIAAVNEKVDMKIKAKGGVDIKRNLFDEALIVSRFSKGDSLGSTAGYLVPIQYCPFCGHKISG